MNLFSRHRRLRYNPQIRDIIRETHLHIDDLIYPLFITTGNNIKSEISSMPGQYHFSVDMLEKEITEVSNLGIKAILLFGLPEYKDDIASSAYLDNGIVQQAIQKIKSINPNMFVITDVCLCQYTSNGQCGVLNGNNIDNDKTIEILSKIALSHAKAGADMVAPSDMMDGRIAAIRNMLDTNNYHYTSIMSYSVKYASSFYGPFRGAADSKPTFGDRKSYQMDPANSIEALREAQSDLEEGADILMVKPAMAYQDIILKLKQNFNLPIAAYNVSGEYSMIKLAAASGLFDEKQAVLESLIGLKRSGADIIITYFTKDVANWLREV